MDNFVRARQASLQVAKAQRRIWLLQAIFWPVIAVGCIATAIAVGGWAWRRRSSPAESNDLLLATDDPASRGSQPPRD